MKSWRFLAIVAEIICSAPLQGDEGSSTNSRGVPEGQCHGWLGFVVPIS